MAVFLAQNPWHAETKNIYFFVNVRINYKWYAWNDKNPIIIIGSEKKKNKFDLKFDQSCGENTKKLNIICVCLSRELCTVLATDKRHYKPIRHSYSGIHANTPDIAIPTNSRPLKSWRSLQKKYILFFYKTPIEFILTLLISNALFFLSPMNEREFFKAQLQFMLLNNMISHRSFQHILLDLKLNQK